jgi:hypothetical protein
LRAPEKTRGASNGAKRRHTPNHFHQITFITGSCMNTFFAFACTLWAGLTFLQTAVSTPATASPLGAFPSSINIRDYGAKGDGIADDTKAIQAAITAAEQQSAQGKWSVQSRHWNHLIKGAAKRAHSEVVFPPGTYKISSTIVIGGFQYLRGSGEAVIEQTDGSKDSFYLQHALYNTIENLRFKGGKNQLHIWTRNLGEARVAIKDCAFSGSTSYAVECTSYVKRILEGDNWRNSAPWAPYEVQMADGIAQLTPNASDNLQAWFHSTLFEVTNCRFDNTAGAVHTNADVTVINQCRVTVNPQMQGAVFRLAGYMTLVDNLKGVAQPATGKHQYWIESADRSQLTMRNSELKSNAAGLCVLRSYAAPSLSSIVLEENAVQSAGCPEGAIVWIARGTQPNILSITGTREISEKPVKAVTWEQTPQRADLEKLKDEQRYSTKETLLEYIYKIQLSDNSSNIDNAVPGVLTPLVISPIPQTALQQTFVPELPWDYQVLEEEARATGKVLLATDFGLDQNPSTDDTANIQKVFAAAASQGLSFVVFPAGVFTVSDTIQLPTNVVVRAAGVASFVQTDAQKDIFQARNAGTIAFKNCNFHGGLNGVQISSDAGRKARIAFDYFSFYDQQENGLTVLAGRGETGEPNQTGVWMNSGSFAALHAITTNAARAQLRNFWALNSPLLNDEAFIRNLGGAMRVQSMVSNPILWQDKGKRPTEIADWQGGKNTRWIDNWGKLYCVDNRFGGESGGMTAVYNRSPDGTVYISGGTASFNHDFTRKCILYLQAKPRLAVLLNIATLPVYQGNASRFSVMNADGANAGSTPGVIVRGVPTP